MKENRLKNTVIPHLMRNLSTVWHGRSEPLVNRFRREAGMTSLFDTAQSGHPRRHAELVSASRVFGAQGGYPRRHAELKRPTRSGSASRAFGAQSGHPRRHAELVSASRVFGAQGGYPRRHAELVSASRRQASESGRSMVEMLGVLAVIGVLSIGGIAGYRTAMDMHAANEIIDSVGKAATQLSVGLVAGTIPSAVTPGLELDETTTTNGYDMAAAIDAPGTFVVQVQGVTKSVCENILNRDWELPLEMTTECADSTDMDFLFANDLSDEAVVMAPLPGGREECSSDADCEGGHCGYGTCIAEEDYCDYQRFEENGCQDKNPNRPHCLAYRCVAGCTSDDDCKGTDNPYCLTFTDAEWNGGGTHSMCVECMENDHCEAGSFCSGSYESCTESSYNTCKKAKVGQSYTASDGKTYYLSSTTMSWWDADNYCKALGDVVGSDLSLVPADILNTKGVDGSENEDNGTNKTALVGELYTGFGSPSGSWVWTSTDYGTSSSSSSSSSSKTCGAYGVYLSFGNLYYGSRENPYRALCW